MGTTTAQRSKARQPRARTRPKLVVRAPGKTVHDPLSFETFLANLSAEFVNVSTERVDSEIQNGLKKLVEFLGVDRATLVTAVTPEDTAMVVGCYAAPGIAVIEPFKPLPGLKEMKWYSNELKNGRVVRLGSIDDLPRHAHAERIHIAAAGMKSHLGIPIRVAELPLCALGIATFRRPFSFPEALLPRLKMVGEIFANAMARRDAERELRGMQSELAHVTRASTVGQLATSIAHEINQPLCAIQTNAHAIGRLLSRPKPDLEDLRAALNDIIADSKRASAVISNAHSMLKRRPVEQVVCSINDIAAEVLRMLHSDMLIRRVKSRTSFFRDIPRIRGDRVQLQQVLMNLVLNAMDSISQAPDGLRQITITTDLYEGKVRVRVTDTGTGLSETVAAQMFDPWFTTKDHGLGMGLSINRQIITSHFGKMFAANERPCGATVGFVLPVARADV